MKSELIVDIEDMSRLAVEDNEAYALNRRKGLGASDSSIILGINKWSKLEDLIEQKNRDYIGEDELAVGEKPQVRMGRDLEPFILDKASEFFGQEVKKPTAQYRVKDYPFLTINYDGAVFEPQAFTTEYTPPVQMAVEAKCVSSYARKYWDWDKSCKDFDDFVMRKNYQVMSNNLTEIIDEQAKYIGIPNYYYTQCQQQMIGTGLPYCALIALDVKEWNVHVFKVFEDTRVQEAIACKGAEVASQCQFIETL